MLPQITGVHHSRCFPSQYTVHFLFVSYVDVVLYDTSGLFWSHNCDSRVENNTLFFSVELCTSTCCRNFIEGSDKHHWEMC